MLLSEDREERNWDKADDNYKDVQRFIIKAEHLELYGDVERLLPTNIKPDCIEMVMEIEEYVREDPHTKRGRKSPMPKAPKRVRNDDVMRNIPTGASTSFVSVKELLQGGSKKRKKIEKSFDELGEDDEDDLDIAAGLSRRTVSMPAPVDKRKKKLRVSATLPTVTEDAQPRKKQSKKKAVSRAPPAAPFESLARDDSDDEAIAQGISHVPSKPSCKSAARPRKPKQPTAATSTMERTRSPPTSRLSLSPVSVPSSPLPTTSKSGVHNVSETSKTATALSMDCDIQPSMGDEIVDLTTPVERSSPFRWSSPEPEATSSKNRGSPSSSPPVQAVEAAGAPNSSMAWLLDDDDDLEIPLVGSSPFTRRTRERNTARSDSSDIELLDAPLSSPSPPTVIPSARRINFSSRADPAASQLAMPPPALPVNGKARAHSPTPQERDSEMSSPALTFAVRGPTKAAKKRLRLDSSSPLVNVPTPQRRIRRQSSQELDGAAGSPKPKKPKKRKFADIVEAKKHNPWIDVEASQSGEESQGGSEDDDVLSDSDRQFVVDGTQTQASPSYDQSAVYRRSLMTQVPAGTVPRFAKAPYRRGAGAFGGPSRPQPRALVSSSPPRDSEPDDYMFGSFVVDDDADISYVDDNQLTSDS